MTRHSDLSQLLIELARSRKIATDPVRNLLVNNDQGSQDIDQVFTERSPARGAALSENAERESRVSTRVDLITMLVLTGIGFWIMFESSEMRLTNALGVGPGMFPFISGALLTGLGLVGSISRLRALQLLISSQIVAQAISHDSVESEVEPLKEEEMFTMVKWDKVGLIALFLAIFVFLADYIGIVLSLALLCFSLMVLVAKRSLRLSIITTFSVVLVVYFGFEKILGLAFPPPSLSFLGWM